MVTYLDLDEVRCRVDELRQRLNATEADVSNIYQSRIWQTLIKTAGVLEKLRAKPH